MREGDERAGDAELLNKAARALESAAAAADESALLDKAERVLADAAATATDAGGSDGHIRVRLYGVAGLAEGRGAAVPLQTLQAPSIALHWGVRTAATHGGSIVVAGGDDGVVHVWTLAERGKVDQGGDQHQHQHQHQHLT